MASAASRHKSSRKRRPVISTPIGSPVPSSWLAGTQAEGSPSKLAGTTGRISSLVAAVPAGVAESKPCSNGNCVQVGVSSSRRVHGIDASQARIHHFHRAQLSTRNALRQFTGGELPRSSMTPG